MELLYLFLGLILLVGAGDALVRGAVALSLRLGIPALLVSVTIVGFGTSAPELLVAVEAALAEAPGIALGNVVGSNIANVLLVLGFPALLLPIAGCASDAHRNLYLMLAATVLFTGLTLGGTIRWWGGLALVAVAFVLICDSLRAAWAARSALRLDPLDALAGTETTYTGMGRMMTATLIGAGIIGLPLGAHLLIEGARGLAAELGVSEAAIGVTVVAVGTSLPELATSVMAAVRRHTDVAIGNVVGSNIFNISFIAGAAALAHPLEVPAEILYRDLWWMIGTSLLLTPFVLFCRQIGRWIGGSFLVLYGFYGYLALAG
jgi:cation:H+ antiporter